MKRLLYSVISLLPFTLYGQLSDPPNIVPNPGFELRSGPPIGWFYKGEHFTDVMKYWSSPTIASPDIFGPEVRVPQSWVEKGFGQQPPYEGNYMTGITTYGCEDGKPHCREYLQIQLTEALVPGQRYELSFKLAPLPQSLRVNRIGAAFTSRRLNELTDGPLALEPVVAASETIISDDGQWQEVKGIFTAQVADDHLIIGNFYTDEQTESLVTCEPYLPFSYYYVDLVTLHKVPPILPVPVAEDDLSKLELIPGKKIRLKNIFFETDEAELLPRSFIELHKLLGILEKHSTMHIEIHGHTDFRGDDAYNQSLSERRAKAVVDYLVEKGISASRLNYRGFGRSQPIADNTTDEGMQQNRRVEFVIRLDATGGFSGEK